MHLCRVAPPSMPTPVPVEDDMSHCSRVASQPCNRWRSSLSSVHFKDWCRLMQLAALLQGGAAALQGMQQMWKQGCTAPGVSPA